ncbi:MAG: hypothetical protein J2P15_03975 [Micromonosporaceae bacterium]|nr:hypothetical protein [Micromonosporaceae bacterium]
MRAIAGVLGAIVVLSTAVSILRNLVVPRGIRSLIVKMLWRGTRGVLLAAVRPWRRYEVLDRTLAWLAPIVLLATLLTWLVLLFVGYGLLSYSISNLSISGAFWEAGSSLFTVGFAPAARGDLTTLDFIAGATGPVVIALQISYLPALYAAYNRREIEVTLLQARAAEPAWGPELLARQALVGTVDELTTLYTTWERLAVDIGESHANYPLLLVFRSPRPYRNWVIGLIAVMDAAAMHLALAPKTAPVAPARLMLRSGFTGLRDIGRVLNLPVEHDPRPEDPLRLTFEEYAAAVAHVTEAGFATERSAEESWPDFKGWRVNYEEIAYALARKVDAVPALWSGGRAWPSEPISPVRPIDRRPDPLDGGARYRPRAGRGLKH